MYICTSNLKMKTEMIKPYISNDVIKAFTLNYFCDLGIQRQLCAQDIENALNIINTTKNYQSNNFAKYIGTVRFSDNVALSKFSFCDIRLV